MLVATPACIVLFLALTMVASPASSIEEETSTSKTSAFEGTRIPSGIEGRETVEARQGRLFADLQLRLTSIDPGLRRRAARELGDSITRSFLPSEYAAALIARGLHDLESSVRLATAEGMSELKYQPATAVPPLLEALGDQDEAVRHAVAYAFGRLHREPDRVLPILIRMRAQQQLPDLVFQQAAAWFKGSDSVPVLVRVIEKGDPAS